ncbi:MAG: ABC transporter substrate-binding protein [Actinomycetota bacterium]|nr:ABC transporter substrate-binding protein [Actinomycetota bacterium]
MRVRARLRDLALGLVGVVLALAACGDTSAPSERLLRIGVLVPLTGPAAFLGSPLAAGAQVWVDSLNAEKGGVAGKYRVELVLRDSRGDPATTVQAYKGLKSEVVMFNVFGTTALKALLPQLERDGGAALANTLDADWIREPNLIPVGVPYQLEAINIVGYYVQAEAPQRGGTVCAMVEDSAFGEAAEEGVALATQELGLDPGETARFRSGDQEFTAQVTQLQRAGCDAIVLAAGAPDTSGILSTAARSRFAPRWLGLAPAWAAALATSPLQDYLEDNFWHVREGAQYGDRSIPGMAEFLAHIERYPPSLDVAKSDPRLINGYTQGKVMTAVLEQAVKEGDVSKEGILRAIPRVGTLSFDGLAADYYYGPIDERGPDPTSPIFKIDATEPFGLAPIHPGFKSQAADRFEPKRGG